MDTLEIWEKGFPLSLSFTKFGVLSKINEYNDIAPKSSGIAMMEQVAKNWENGVGFMDAIQGVSSKVSPDMARTRALRQELQIGIIRYVRKGQLLAYGFSQPRHASDVPQQIPSDLWQGNINWEKDRIEGNGLQMSAVRITHSNWIETPQQQISPLHEEIISTTDAPRPAGRPSRKDQITEAFHSLAENEQIDFSKPAKYCYENVRVWVQSHYPDEENNDKGLGDKAMEKHVNPLFNSYK